MILAAPVMAFIGLGADRLGITILAFLFILAFPAVVVGLFLWFRNRKFQSQKDLLEEVKTKIQKKELEVFKAKKSLSK